VSLALDNVRFYVQGIADQRVIMVSTLRLVLSED
jgi:hypothetical protein